MKVRVSCVWMNDGYLTVQVCMCVSMYGGWLVGDARQWCLVEDTGTWSRWRRCLGSLVEYIVWL